MINKSGVCWHVQHYHQARSKAMATETFDFDGRSFTRPVIFAMVDVGVFLLAFSDTTNFSFLKTLGFCADVLLINPQKYAALYGDAHTIKAYLLELEQAYK